MPFLTWSVPSLVQVNEGVTCRREITCRVMSWCRVETWQGCPGDWRRLYIDRPFRRRIARDSFFSLVCTIDSLHGLLCVPFRKAMDELYRDEWGDDGPIEEGYRKARLADEMSARDALALAEMRWRSDVADTQ